MGDVVDAKAVLRSPRAPGVASSAASCLSAVSSRPDVEDVVVISKLTDGRVLVTRSILDVNKTIGLMNRATHAVIQANPIENGGPL